MKQLLLPLFTILISFTLIACGATGEIAETEEPKESFYLTEIFFPSTSNRLEFPEVSKEPEESEAPKESDAPEESEIPEESKAPIPTVRPTANPSSSEVPELPEVVDGEKPIETVTPTASIAPTPFIEHRPEEVYNINGEWVFEENPDIGSYLLEADGAVYAKDGVGAVYARGTYIWDGSNGEMNLEDYGTIGIERIDDVIYFINPSDNVKYVAILEE